MDKNVRKTSRNKGETVGESGRAFTLRLEYWIFFRSGKILSNPWDTLDCSLRLLGEFLPFCTPKLVWTFYARSIDILQAGRRGREERRSRRKTITGISLSFSYESGRGVARVHGILRGWERKIEKFLLVVSVFWVSGKSLGVCGKSRGGSRRVAADSLLFNTAASNLPLSNPSRFLHPLSIWPRQPRALIKATEQIEKG